MTDVLESIKEVCQSHAVDGCDECEYHRYWDKWDEEITCAFKRVPGNWAIEQIEVERGACIGRVYVEVIVDTDSLEKGLAQISLAVNNASKQIEGE